MPAVTRVEVDSHIGHASPTPNPFHQHPYAEGSSDVITNDKSTVRIGDETTCGDPAIGGSSNVFINNLEVHRKGDPTGGHDSWVPNESASGSDDVFIGDSDLLYEVYNQVTQKTEQISIEEISTTRAREQARIDTIVAGADTEEKRKTLGPVWDILNLLTTSGTGWASTPCTWVNHSTTVNDVITSLWAKVEVLNGDRYIEKLEEWTTNDPQWFRPITDISATMGPEVSKNVYVGSTLVNVTLNLDKFHRINNATQKLPIKSIATTGVANVKCYEWFKQDVAREGGDIIVYRSGTTLAEQDYLPNQFKALVKQALTDGHNNQYINLEELKQSIDSWVVPMNAWLTQLNSNNPVLKIPFYIIDYTFKPTYLNWATDIINGTTSQTAITGASSVDLLSGFSVPGEHMVIHIAADDGAIGPLHKLQTTLHESAHFLHDPKWGTPDQDSVNSFKMLSPATMGKLYAMWNEVNNGGVNRIKNLKYFRQTPNVCVGGSALLHPREHEGLYASQATCNNAGGRFIGGSRSWDDERIYRGNLAWGIAGYTNAGKAWTDLDFERFKSFIANPNHPHLQHLKDLYLYSNKSVETREEEFLVRVYAIMSTNKCVGFKKDLAWLINEYNAILNGIPLTIPDREAELVDEDIRNRLMLNKRVL